MKIVKVMARALLPLNELARDDQDLYTLITGDHFFETSTDEPKEEALNLFHISIPIKVLDDFDIQVIFVPSGKNENTLTDMICQECGNEDVFLIAVEQMTKVTDDETDHYGDTEWFQTTYCRCNECDFAGTVADFTYSEDKKEEPGKHPYSVLLLYPYASAIETYFDHTEAATVKEASVNVRKMASEANNGDIKPDDFIHRC